MSRDDPFVFAYRLVLEHGDGTRETLDPELLPLPIDTSPGMTLSFSDIRGDWQVERIENESPEVFTRSQFEADPTLRVATAFLREAPPG